MTFKAPESLPMFFAHAIALERESVERYGELADVMDIHNNEPLSKLFRRLAGYGEQHAAEVERLAEGFDLPRLAPWEFKWIDSEGPETAGYDGAHYLMTPHHALQVALENERRGEQYYARVADETLDPEVSRVAREFAEEEGGHVALVEKWLQQVDKPRADWDLDLDPPQQPE